MLGRSSRLSFQCLGHRELLRYHLLSFHQHEPTLSSFALCSTSSSGLNIPKDLLPSRSFIKNLHNYEKNKLARLLAEMELILEISSEVPKQLSDEQWKFYFNLTDVVERGNFLRNAFLEDLAAAERAKNGNEMRLNEAKISEVQEGHYRKGEMVYARRFHELLDLRGQDFRKAIDRMYGCRLLAAERSDESLPKLLVDCRFLMGFGDVRQRKYVKELQKLHERNWFCRNPFPISFVNLVSDDKLAGYLKKYLLFLTGPPRIKEKSSKDDFACVYDEIDAKFDTKRSSKPIYEPHPFIPTLSSRSIRENLGDIKSDEVAYISWKTTNVLDGPPSRFKAFVICASDDMTPWKSSLSAARTDEIAAFRLPIQKYVEWKGNRTWPLENVAGVLRSACLNSGDWKSAVLENNKGFQDKDEEGWEESSGMLKVLHRVVNEMEAMNVKAVELGGENHEEHQKAKDRIQMMRKMQARKRGHKYSREERRARRLAEAQAAMFVESKSTADRS